MLLEWEIGQLFMFGFEGRTPDPKIQRKIEELKPGGVIHFARNTGAPARVLALNRALQDAALSAGTPPLLVALDQEGGTVARLVESFPVFPSNMAFGAIYARDPDSGMRLCFEAALTTARALRALGFNMNLAPCVDVNTNYLNPVIGVRSFSDRPAAVARLGNAALRGHACGGVLATAKHFPGHGDTAVDSHIGLPSVVWDLEFEQTHVFPFREAISAGAEAVMTAHLVCQKRLPNGTLQPGGSPATLSRDVLTGCLRGRLGFGGLIITDCMEMGAITQTFGASRAAVMALRAGVDMVLVSHTEELQRRSLEAVKEAIREGDLDEREIRAKLRRIAGARSSVAERHGAGSPGSGGREHSDGLGESDPAGAYDLVARTAALSITLLRRDFTPPRDSGPPVVIAPNKYGSTLVEDTSQSPLGKVLDMRLPGATHVLYSPEPTLSEAARCTEAARSASWVVFAAINLHLSSAQARLARAVLRANWSFVLLDMVTPFSLTALPEAPCAVVCYGYAPCQLAAALDVILGDKTPMGCLPVDVPGFFPFGFGLDGAGGVIQGAGD